jgi:2-iminobutanoate/2-iminopropanoate deaminase
VVSVEGLGHGKQPIPLAVTVGPLLVTGNVSGVDKDSGTQPAELRDEIANAFANVGHVLDAAGFGLDDLAKVEVLLADPAARDTLNEVWTDLFPNADDRPARHTSVANLPNSLRVQVSITAMRP